MRILQVSNYFKPSWEGGGPVRDVYELSKALVRRGHEVTVYATDGFKNRVHAPTNQPIEMEGMRVFYFSNLSNFLASRTNIQTPFLASPIIRADMKKFDVAHIHEGNALLGTVVHHYARRNSVPIVFQPHGGLTAPSVLNAMARNAGIVRTLRLGVALDADACIAVTTNERRAMVDLGIENCRISVVPNGINWADYEILPERGAFREEYGIEESDQVVLYLGRIHKIKGLDLLVKSFSAISRQRDGVKLVIVGPDDGYLGDLKEMIADHRIKDKTILTGPLFEADARQAFVDSDVYVLPSMYDVFGLTVLEASACGLPVIVTEECGMRDFVTIVGYVVQRDEAALASKLLELLNNDTLRSEMGRVARSQVEKLYSWETIVTMVEEVYKEVIQKSFDSGTE
jgi:glycosyltransferase involved in cell wall biosynthesis